MFNSKHGLKFDVGFLPLKRDYNFNSFNKSFQIRYSAQYVLNFGRLFHFEKFAPRFSGLLHVGGGISALKYQESLYFKNWKSNLTDETINLIFGITPQFKINDRIEIHLDFSYNPELFQEFDRGFQWSDFTKESVFGRKSTFSFGGTYYIGKHKTHSDWLFDLKTNEKKVIDSIPDKIDSNLITKINYDLDNDGIMDSVDFCPDIFGLKEFDGCPQPEITFDCSLSDFPIFQFKGARFEIQDIYLQYIDSIALCMKANPDKKIIIYGFTDDFGDEIYTDGLSQSRANQIKNALVEKGIDENRMFTLGEGRKKAKLSDENKKTIKHNRLAFIEPISRNQDDIRVLETGEYLQGLFFTVQIGAYKKELKNNKFNKLGKVLVTKNAEGIHRYSINVYQNFEDATSKWKEIRNFGFAQDSFVAAYFLGERITIKEAQRLINERGNSVLQK
jgi:OmpA-OmpF porin, OOP family